MTNSASSSQTESQETRKGLSDRLFAVAEVAAPLTIITALLYYYGYVTSQARFGYFGLDLSVLNMSSQEIVLRSAGALYLPLVAILIFVGVAGWIHWRIVIASSGGAYRHVFAILGVTLVLIGCIALIRALYGVLTPEVAETEFAGTTPLSLVIGVTLVVYGERLRRRVGPTSWWRSRLSGLLRTARDRARWLNHAIGVLERWRSFLRGDESGGIEEDESGLSPLHPPARWRHAANVIVTCGLLILGLFWATNSFAAAYGRGQAIVDSMRLNERPEVVLDTKERLYLRYPGVAETELLAVPGQEFHFRYRGLRLLIAANGKLFLLPERWIEGGQILLVEGGGMRVQFGPGVRR